mgnify:CR=1 FL=1
MELTKEQIRETIARRVAQELKEGDYVTLGIGLPTEVANYIPENVHVMIQSENGLIGVGKKPAPDKVDPKITNAGGIPVTTKQGAAFFDSQMSFAFLNRSSHPRRRQKAAQTGTCRTNLLHQRSHRGQFDLQFPGVHLLSRFGIGSDMCDNRLFDSFIGNQLAAVTVGKTSVIGD